VWRGTHGVRARRKRDGAGQDGQSGEVTRLGGGARAGEPDRFPAGQTCPKACKIGHSLTTSNVQWLTIGNPFWGMPKRQRCNSFLIKDLRRHKIRPYRVGFGTQIALYSWQTETKRLFENSNGIGEQRPAPARKGWSPPQPILLLPRWQRESNRVAGDWYLSLISYHETQTHKG